MDNSILKERGNRVASEFDGIIGPFEAFYVESIIFTALRCLTAFDRYERAVSTRSSAAAIVDSAHEALTHAADLSRYFWPASREHKELAKARASRLRQSFGVVEGSPLESRALRDALEHFDERLDKYLLGDLAGTFWVEPLVGDAVIADDPRGHVFRLVDPSSLIFVIFGEKHEFGGLRQEVERVLQQAIAKRDNGGRL